MIDISFLYFFIAGIGCIYLTTYSYGIFKFSSVKAYLIFSLIFLLYAINLLAATLYSFTHPLWLINILIVDLSFLLIQVFTIYLCLQLLEGDRYSKFNSMSSKLNFILLLISSFYFILEWQYLTTQTEFNIYFPFGFVIEFFRSITGLYIIFVFYKMEINNVTDGENRIKQLWILVGLFIFIVGVSRSIIYLLIIINPINENLIPITDISLYLFGSMSFALLIYLTLKHPESFIISKSGLINATKLYRSVKIIPNERHYGIKKMIIYMEYAKSIIDNEE